MAGDLLELFGVLSVAIGTPLLFYLVYTLIQRLAGRGGTSHDVDRAAAAELRALRERVAQLEQSVDVVAVEVERVGEAQRFTARLLGERGAVPGGGRETP